MTSLTAQRRLDLSNYTMVWNDEFDYQGTQQQIHYQMFDVRNAKWLNGFSYKTPYTEDQNGNIRIITRDNVNVSDGTLKLTARFGNDYASTTWKGVTISSENTRSVLTANYDNDYYCLKHWDDDGDGVNDRQIGFNYGIFEIRAKIPRRHGDYSAYWFWATVDQCGVDSDVEVCTNNDENPDPNTVYNPLYTGYELDVFEAKQIHNNDDDNFVYWGSLLPNGMTTPQCIDCRTFYDWKFSDPSEEFHTYTFAWTPDKMTWFIDGNEIRTEEQGVPKVKLDLILSMWNYVEGESETYEIDYVRVYRPNGINYTPTPYYQWGTQYRGDYIWNTQGNPDRLIYEQTFVNTPYMVNQNYRKVGNQVQVQNYTDLVTLQIPESMVIDELNGSSNRIYYTKNNGKIYLVNNASLSLSNPMTIVNTGVHINTNLAVHPISGALFWKDSNNRLKVRYQSGGNWYISHVDVSWQYPNDVKGNIMVSPPNSEHGTRVYYISTSNDRLCYYEYCGGWFRHETQVTGVKEFIISPDPQGKIFYRGSDNHIWIIWKFWDSSTLCNSSLSVSGWNYGPIDFPYDADFADCAGNLAISPNGEKLFYRTITGDLAHWSVKGIVQRFLADVNDVAGDIEVGETTDGRTEVFYVAQATSSSNDHKKVKTYYERTAPIIGGETLWQSGTLDVFSPGQGGNGLGSNYTTGYFVGDELAITTSGLNKVFCMNYNSNQIFDKYLGVYMEATNWNPIPPPYENCSNQHGWHNGFEGLIVPNSEGEVAEESLKEIHREDMIIPKDIQQENIIYPNPTNGWINLVLKDNWCGASVKILNMTGQIIYQSESVCNIVEIDLSNYSKGIYVMQIQYNGEIETKKIVKQ